MKALILAGGLGSRLQPLSVRKPKPMVRLFDRPLLEHLIRLLTAHGFRELCITLRYLPDAVTAWFGDGSAFGCSIEYRIETQPLGTAGSAAACADFIGNDTVLLLGADTVCDADLTAFLRFHRAQEGLVSILGTVCPEPSEYGLILSDDNGRISGFIEKPAPDRLTGELVNTGIYLAEPALFQRIPAGIPCDFGSELFPALLAESQKLCVCEHHGYWNDVGSCERLRQTARDVLDGKAKLPLPVSAEAPPRCWVSPEAELAPGAKLLPYSVIGSGSHIGKDSTIDGSIVDGSDIGENCRLSGCILAPGSRIGSGSVLSEGCVIADGVTIGSGSYVAPGCTVAPGLVFPPGSSLHDAAVPGIERKLRFEGEGVLRCDAGLLSPELLLRMGAACGKLGRCAAAGASEAARLPTQSFLLGCAAAGCRTFDTDARDPADAAFAASLSASELSLFIRREGEQVSLFFYDRFGLPLDRPLQRTLEAALSTPAAAPARFCSPPVPMSGVTEAHIAAAAAAAQPLRGLQLAAAAGSSLAAALQLGGAVLVPPADGVLSLRQDASGFLLEAVDEAGTARSHGELLCALLLTELESGARCLTLPYSAPAAADILAEQLGGRVLRLRRDGSEALAVYRKKPYARDALFLALRLCAALSRRGETLAALSARIPPFETSEALMEPKTSAARLMNALRKEHNAETVSGLRFQTEKGCATVSADTLGRLRIFAESSAFEAADELCAEIRDRLRELDG